MIILQGDLEREKLNLKPIPMMDREKRSEFPSMQVRVASINIS